MGDDSLFGGQRFEPRREAHIGEAGEHSVEEGPALGDGIPHGWLQRRSAQHHLHFGMGVLDSAAKRSEAFSCWNTTEKPTTS